MTPFLDTAHMDPGGPKAQPKRTELAKIMKIRIDVSLSQCSST
jgi:hypothetical protein